MKIFLFSTQWPEYMIELANALSAHGRVTLMLPDNHRYTPAHRKLIFDKVNFHPFKVIFHKSIRDNFKMLFYILKIIWGTKPDIIHIQANGLRLFYWIFFLKPLKSKIINTIHDPVKHIGDEVSLRAKDRSAIYWGKIFTKAYIVHGKKLKILLHQAYGVKFDKIHVIPHGHFGIYKKLQNGKVEVIQQSVLFFGRIWKYKGLSYFIEAGNLVIEKFPNAKFFIVGVGEDITPYLKMIKFPKNFIIVNERVPIEKAGEYFEMVTMVVLPYIEATQSGVIPVAYAYKKPVISTNVGALSEVVKDGVTGFLVESKNAKIIAKKIEFLFKNPKTIEFMKKNIGSLIKSDLSWETIASKTYKLYKK